MRPVCARNFRLARCVHSISRPPTRHGRLEHVFPAHRQVSAGRTPTNLSVRSSSNQHGNTQQTTNVRPGDTLDIPESEIRQLGNDIPPPRRPKPMLRVSREKEGLRGFLSRMFGKKHETAERLAQTYLAERLKNTHLHTSFRFLGTDRATPVLYWYCVDVSFLKSDFARLLPDKSIRVGNYDPALDNIDFTMTRARDPTNLTRWMGYFLRFDSVDAAMVYYQETQGSELGGMALKLKFVDDSMRGLSSPLLEKVPGLSRTCHALCLGLPPGFSPRHIMQVLWEYEFIDDERVAVEKLPIGQVRYGGNPFLLRFKTEDEASRFVRDYHQTIFPTTYSKVLCEVVD